MKYTIHRTGAQPISFEGYLLADVGGPWRNGREYGRWYNFQLYSIAPDDGYLAVREYRSSYLFGEGYREVQDGTDNEVIDWLRSHDPTSHMPPGSGRERGEALTALYWDRVEELIVAAGLERKLVE